MLIELAVKANCDYIITYNKRDFADADRFGIEVLDPFELLERIGETG
ncbi:MAG TPA: PIN domain-containing protein [Thermoanaerobaculia bacterium]|jgi:predicted nucleic acid-binding protein